MGSKRTSGATPRAAFVAAQGLGTSTKEEAQEYFSKLRQHRKEFVWTGGAAHGRRSSATECCRVDSACAAARCLPMRPRAVRVAPYSSLLCPLPAGDEDGDAIELAFSKKRVDNRKEWLSAFVPGTYLDQSAERISYSDFINRVRGPAVQRITDCPSPCL
jgi:DNA topoisomerase-2